MTSGVVGEQRDHRVDVAALDGVGEAPDQLPLAGGVRPWRALAVGGRQLRSERRAGALQGALDRGLAGVEQLGDLGGAEAEHVAEHQGRALAGRQVLEGDDERELDRLPGLVARRRPRERSGMSSSSTSGYGSSQTGSVRRVGSSASAMAGTSLGRRERARSAFRQRLVAIRYSQERTDARPSNASRLRQAASSVSCTRSSASCTEPRMR